MKRVISRFLYCIGFVSIAVNFMLPVHKVSKSNDFMNQPPEDDDLLFSTSESNKKTKCNYSAPHRKNLIDLT